MSSPTKIELVTQPLQNPKSSVRDQALRKLLDLVDKNTTEEPDQESSDAIEALNKDKSKGIDYSKEVLDYSPSSINVDSDGFEIPLGKIPLDGHFSTEEVKELVELSKEGGLLKEEVIVQILETNDVVGDRVEVVEQAD